MIFNNQAFSRKFSNFCIYYPKNDISVMYPIHVDYGFHNGIIFNEDSSKLYDTRTLYAVHGKIESVQYHRKVTVKEFIVAGEKLSHSEYNEVYKKYMSEKLNGVGLSLIDYDSDDEDNDDIYNAHYTIFSNQFKSELQVEEVNTLVDNNVDISDKIKFIVYDDIPFDQYINVVLPYGEANLDFSKGLFILDTKQLYIDLVKKFCEYHKMTFTQEKVGQLGEYDKIDGKYINSTIGKLNTFKQYLSYEECLQGKCEFKSHILSRLSILRSNVKDLNVTALLESVNSLKTYLSENDVKMSSKGEYRKLNIKIDKIIKDIEESCPKLDEEMY